MSARSRSSPFQTPYSLPVTNSRTVSWISSSFGGVGGATLLLAIVVLLSVARPPGGVRSTGRGHFVFLSGEQELLPFLSRYLRAPLSRQHRSLLLTKRLGRPGAVSPRGALRYLCNS